MAKRGENKKIKKKVSKQERERHFRLSLKRQLLIGFLVPILFVIFVGQYAYQKASDALVQNYEKSALVAGKMTTQLLDLGFSSVESDSLQLYNNAALHAYIRNKYKDDAIESRNNADEVSKAFISMAVGDPYVSEIHLITNGEMDNMTSSGKNKSAFTNAQWKEKYSDGEKGALSRAVWISEHSEYDKELGKGTDNYICSVYRMTDLGNSYIVIDVDQKKIQSVLDELDMGENSIVSFVTADGRELSAQQEVTFSDKDYYQKSVTQEEVSDTSYVKVNGVEYLYMYVRCEKNNSAICALVPKTNIMAEAIKMRNVVYLLIFAATLMVLAIALFITRTITIDMSQIIDRLTKVSQGDLTVHMYTGSKTEFGKLATNVMNSVSNTKKLIEETLAVSGELKDAVDQVNMISQDLREVSEGIQMATSEIDEGLNQQATDATDCLSKMDSLSLRIEETDQCISNMGNVIKDTESEIDQSVLAMEEVNRQSDTIGKDSHALGSKISELESASKSIQKFVGTIKEIAEQTNLLSLNATIEAARAGESGRGFAVVAQEIKALADNSITASEEITKIVQKILEMTKETVQSAELTGKSIENQKVVVEKTSESFSGMTQSVESLIHNLSEVNEQMNQMENDRKDTHGAIESISSVIQETAASSTSVKDAVENQMEQVNQLIAISKKLDQLTRQIQESIEHFQL